jgi:type VI secretion system protein ImpB
MGESIIFGNLLIFINIRHVSQSHLRNLGCYVLKSYLYNYLEDLMASKVSNNAQKFIGRNRAPRVQIEYDVEIYGSERKIELPFVMAVLSDLSGKPVEPLPPVADRKFLDIDIDNFDERMKAIKPRVAFSVPNTLTDDGYLMVDLTFESMEDFSPAAVARKVDALNQLLEARTQLFNLQTYMDGKSGAEGLINQLLQDPALMQALASAPKPEADAPEVPQADNAETAAPASIE